MANFTISGAAYLPDGNTPLDGYWRISQVTSNGAVLEADGDWRGGELLLRVIGEAELTLPGSEGDESYRFDFFSKDNAYKLGPYYLALTEDIHWGDLIDTPVGVPVNPDVLSQVSQLLADAEDVDDVLVAALINNASSQTKAALENYFMTRAGAAHFTVSNSPPSSPSLNDVWADIS